jgi:hypothetical protein
MVDESRTAHPRSECGAHVDMQAAPEERVEIVLPDHYRLPREANRALAHVIMAVRDRMFGSERGIA